MSKVNPLIDKLSVLYGEPRTSNPAAFIATYRHALAKYDANTLANAANIIARSRKISSWPTIGECLDAVAIAQKQANSAGIALEPIEDFEGWYGALVDQVKHADSDAVIQDALARVRPYAEARWCFPHRLSDLQNLGDMRRKHLAVASARNVTGEHVD